jgi:hypothetical protein
MELAERSPIANFGLETGPEGRRPMNRRFPPPWTVERLPGGFKVIDANAASHSPISMPARMITTRTPPGC